MQQFRPARCVGFLAAAAACAASGALAAVDVRSTVTPIQKVLQMLNGMLEKGKQEKHEEEVAFAAFSQFCTSTSAEKARTIKAAADSIAQLQVAIQKAEAEASTLGAEIGELDSSIAGWDADAKAASSVRSAEASDYAATRQDYSESLSALDRAIQVLKTRSQDVPQATALAQLTSVQKSPALVARALRSFLQADAASTELGPPQANAYESQSGDVVKMLEDLRQRFSKELEDLDKAEANRRHSYELLAQRLTDDVNYGQKSRTEKAATKASRLESAADGKADLARAEADKTADEKYLQDLTASCRQKSQEFETRQNTRSSELSTISKAIEIIASPEVSGAGEKHLPALVQTAKPRALAQLRRRLVPAVAGTQERASQFLKHRAQEVGSAFIATVAERVAEDPFVKVRKMIQDLLVKLQEEANAEASHKGWCDAELATNKQSRDDLGSEADRLASKVDELTAEEQKLAQNIKFLSGAIAEISATLAQAAARRQEEKARNAATVAEARAAQAAVMRAVSVLREFYASAAKATAMIQKRQTPDADAPATWGSSYTGMQGETGGVVGMLEVIQSDFARLEAETSSAEDEAQRDYDRLVADSETDKEAKDAEMRHDGYAKDRTSRDLNNAKKELEATRRELDAAEQYFEKLKPTCIDSGRSYAERVAQRQAEIQSLQEALRILEGEDLSR